MSILEDYSGWEHDLSFEMEKYCEFCGLPLGEVTVESEPSGFDTFTGEPKHLAVKTCPQYVNSKRHSRVTMVVRGKNVQ